MNKTKDKRISKIKKRRKNRIRMGKFVPFSLSNCSKKLKGCSYKYNYKTNVHHCIFKDSVFSFVRYRSGHITETNFKNAKFNNVDFLSTNLKNSKFVNATFTNCLFFGCNLKDSDFKNAKFINTYFICCKLDNIKNFDKASGIIIINKYPTLSLSAEINHTLSLMKNIIKLEKNHILTTKDGKINQWLISILLTIYTEEELLYFFNKLLASNKTQFYTFGNYITALQKYYKK